MNKTGTKALLTAVVAVVIFTGMASAGWWDGVGDAQTIDLQDVIDSPRKWKGKEIVFECYFHETSDFYNPYYTRFLPAQYVNFSVWPAGTRLWNKEEYAHSFHFLFIEKDHKRFGYLVGTKKFAHLKLRGYVQNTFKSVPWIEIRAVEVIESGFTKDTLREIILGDRAADREQWGTALGHYDQAASASLPREVMAGIEHKRGQAYEGLGQHEAATAAYARALKLDHDGFRTATVQDMPGEAMAEARPIDKDRYPPKPMAMPAPVKAAPIEVPAETAVEEPTQPVPTEVVPTEPVEAPIEATPPAEVAPEQPVEATPPVAPVRDRKTPKKRMSGPV